MWGRESRERDMGIGEVVGEERVYVGREREEGSKYRGREREERERGRFFSTWFLSMVFEFWLRN
jgi:hypothetical protein